MHFFDQDLIAFGVLLDFGDHDLIKEIDLPKFLIITTLFVILGID
jgi:hypothetical protein